MALNYISAAEAASLIKHGYNIGILAIMPLKSNIIIDLKVALK